MSPELARAMFRRTLAGWASDSLRLRRKRLDTPSVRCGRGVLTAGWDTVGAIRPLRAAG